MVTLKIDLFADGRICVARDGVDNQLVNFGLLEVAKDILKKEYAGQQTLIQPVRKAA